VIVDWEGIRHGDFAWDVAGMLQEIWVRWIASMPLDSARRPSPHSATLQFAELSAAAENFWESYCSRRPLNSSARASLWMRAVRFSAARLVQSALERVKAFGGVGFETVSLLQMSENILKDPAAAGRLLREAKDEALTAS
jgi:hypothetical protein